MEKHYLRVIIFLAHGANEIVPRGWFCFSVTYLSRTGRCVAEKWRVLLLLLGTAGVILYFIYRPQVPHFSVKTLQIPHLTVTTSKSSDTTLNTQVAVDVEATNPNKVVTFFYEESKVSVAMDKVSLGEGTFPAFFHGNKNTTALKISNVKAMNTAIDQSDGNDLKLKYTQKKLKLKLITVQQ